MSKTDSFKSSFGGTVGSVMKSVFNPSGKRFYILEHRNDSQYHRAGEAQNIIVDEATIGRDPKCTVRFDEDFNTVSRMHAAIRHEGENYVLYHLSKTNPTLVNGSPVQGTYYLKNGDEIQLSSNGPRLGFIIPQGEQSLVKSLGLTARLNLFRKQALRPYKTALSILCALLALAIAGGVIYGVKSNKKIKELTILSDQLKHQQDSLLLEQTRIQNLLDSMDRVEPTVKHVWHNGAVVDAKKLKDEMEAGIAPEYITSLDQVKGSVCYVETTVMADVEGEPFEVGKVSGSGFLLSDGTFITARHMVTPWLYPSSILDLFMNSKASTDEVFLYSKVKVFFGDKSFTLNSNDFKMDVSKDVKWTDGNGTVYNVAFPMNSEHNMKAMSTDWAAAATRYKGNIQIDAAASMSPVSGQDVYIMGFPGGLGYKDSEDVENIVNPIYNQTTIARQGLNNADCITISNTVDHGNSGGPAFIIRDGKLYAIGIVSRIDKDSQKYAHIVPIKNVVR